MKSLINKNFSVNKNAPLIENKKIIKIIEMLFITAIILIPF